jgi:hypothetical protein
MCVRARPRDAAFIGPSSNGTFVAEFDRDATTLAKAVYTAISDLTTAVPALISLRPPSRS